MNKDREKGFNNTVKVLCVFTFQHKYFPELGNYKDYVSAVGTDSHLEALVIFSKSLSDRGRNRNNLGWNIQHFQLSSVANPGFIRRDNWCFVCLFLNLVWKVYCGEFIPLSKISGIIISESLK